MRVHLRVHKDSAPVLGTSKLRVGDLARETGKTVRALHLYEELGLLGRADRSKGGFRLYDGEAVVRVRWIAKLQEMGFSLSDIKEIVRGWEQSGSAPSAMRRVKELYRQQLQQTRAQLARLETLRADLEASLDYLETCDTCDPVRLVAACPSCELPHCQDHAPALVAGIAVMTSTAPAPPPGATTA